MTKRDLLVILDDLITRLQADNAIRIDLSDLKDRTESMILCDNVGDRE